MSSDVGRAGHGTDVVSMLVGNGVAADGGAGTRGFVREAEVMFYATALPDEQYDPDGPQCENYDAEAEEFYADKGIEFETGPDYFRGSPDAYAAWHAIDHGADVIVYSIISGDLSGWNTTLKKALRAGVPVVAGTSNPDGEINSTYYPYSLNGTVAVSGVDNDGNLLNGGGNATGDTFSKDAFGSSNLGFVSASMHVLTPSSWDGWEPTYGSGTSLATPLVAGTLAIGMQKFPDATANQVLQAMIRTTGNAGIHEPEWVSEKWGYGIASPTALLTSEPTDYPDENPLFAFDMDDPRCIFAEEGKTGAWEGMIGMEGCAWAISPTGEDVWPADKDDVVAAAEPNPGENPAPETAAPETAAPTLGDTPQDMAFSAVWVVAGVVLVGGVLTTIIVAVAVARSRKRKPPVPPSSFEGSQAYRR